MGKHPLHWINCKFFDCAYVAAVSSAFAYRYDPWYRADTERPVDIITDVINDLGVKILQQYTGHGNIAFSPTGIAFVLAALYEGSTGRGSQQIAEVIRLPPRDVTRIGLRDIHRRLRSYLNADGFLGGLTLSKENTVLRPEYEDILRFYGFDLSSIEQEANVTVNTEDSSVTTPALPTSTASSTIPMEPIETRNEPDTTTTLTITTLPSETTITSSATPQSVTEEQPITVASPESTVPSTSSTPESTVPSTSSTPEPAVPSTSSTPESAVSSTSSIPEPAVPSTSSTPESAVSSTSSTPEPAVPSTSSTPESAVPSASSTPGSSPAVISEESVQPTSTTIITNDRASSTVVEDAGGDQIVANTTIPNSTENAEDANAPDVTSNVNIETPQDADRTTTAANVLADDRIQSDITDGNPVTSNSLISAISTSLTDSTNLTTLSPVIETTDNSVISQSRMTSVSAELPAGNTPEMIARDLATTPIISVNHDATMSSVQAINTTMTSRDLVEDSNDFAIVNSTDNQANGNAVSTNRKKKGAEPDLKVVLNDGTVRDESINRGSPNLRRTRSPRGYFSSYPDEGIWMQDLEIWKSYSNPVNPSESPAGDSAAEISFLVNGCDVSSVSASRYIAVLPFAYFPSLHAVALEFPLDDPRYNIILLMPTDKTDTHRLARDLSGKSLRSLRKRLQPTWVRATIPSFMLRGFVTLTSFLQRLGIVDVFEPRLANLSPMTSDLGVYARDVQQSIGVNIRNYMKPDRTHSRNGLFERAGPVPFTALHPFFYFIVDTETSVSLIAGRVDDPLNSRIL
ncbi:chitinase-like protein PB1E7.04c [Nylanderia fulva]|uniref:chitinase-like protein PB1E7.04c n=1 Tax=Nylanderia fulva TaxID=613905 RepID=UPI0010FBA17A|nr:chitinase-like protein PB1E7.04c [Nylanderia fulva]